MANEVTVATKSEGMPRRPGPTGLAALSPIQAGLLYGGVSAPVLGPFALIAGLGAGILSKRLRQNFLDREAADVQNLRSEHKGLMSEIQGELEIADPEEKRMLQHAQRLATDGWYRLQSGDETGREMIQQANEMSRNIMSADQQVRRQEESQRMQMQRDLIKDAANNYRNEFQQNLSLAEDADKQAMRVLQLVADPNFDPDKPFNRAVLGDLLLSGGPMFETAPNMLDAVSQGAPTIGAILGARGGPGGAAIGDTIGGLVGSLVSGLKSKDFKISREEYNRIALNMRQFTKQYASERMGRLGAQASQLDGFAKQVGAIPQDYSLGDFVTGGVKELRMLPTPTMPKMSTNRTSQTVTPQGRPPPTESFLGPINSQLRRLDQFMKERQKRPTN